MDYESQKRDIARVELAHMHLDGLLSEVCAFSDNLRERVFEKNIGGIPADQALVKLRAYLLKAKEESKNAENYK